MKIKSTDSKANALLLKGTKLGKIKKHGQNDNKLVNAAGKADDLKIVCPKDHSFVEHAGGKKNNGKKSKNKPATEEKIHESGQVSQEANSSLKNMPEKQKKKDTSSARDTKELKKIERKKAKKLAKKLKIQQKKANNVEVKKSIVTSNIQSDESVKRKLDGISDSNKKNHLDEKGNDQTEKLPANEIVDVANKEQLYAKKKEKRERKRGNGGATSSKTEQTKNINTEEDVNTISSQIKNSVTFIDKKSQNLDVIATSSKVLTKKEKKAEKRRMLKDQKLAESQTRDPAVEAATVFVGNLPVNTKRNQLINLFKKFGPVKTIRMRSAGGSVLYKHKQRKLAGSLNAYVVFQSKEKAENSLSLNGIEFKNHHLRVTLATKSQDENDVSKKTVFVGNLKYSASEDSLLEVFSSCGEVEYVRCIRDGDKGCKGVAYVCFKSADAVGLALELNGTIVDERPIHVERYNIKKLGAKEARIAQKENEGKSKMGVKLRLEGKKAKTEKNGQKSNQALLEEKKSKKSEFRGVKVNSFKKQKSKKKKSNDQMIKLAKKIAPKTKSD